jgi:hypothetical protein
MKKILFSLSLFASFNKSLLAVALLSTTLSSIAGWSNTGISADGEQYFVDKDTFRGEQLRRGWFLISYKDGALGFKSEKQLWIANCKNEQVDLIQFVSYSETMGAGAIVASQAKSGNPNFIYPTPNSIGDSILKLLCSSRK